MGLGFCGFRSRPCRNVTENRDENCGLMNFVKPRSFWTASKTRKSIQFGPQENKQEQVIYKSMASKVLTLEEWILSSPDINKGNANGVDHNSLKLSSSSRRIHPSFDHGEMKRGFLPESLETSMSVEGRMKVEEGENSSLCRSKSGKSMKKVSFRSPEVADVFMLEYPPEMYFPE